MLRPELIDEIHKLETHEDCRMASTMVKAQLERVTMQAGLEFHVGQKVTFMSKKRGGMSLVGTVAKINRKSISVDVPNGRYGYPEKWTVGPSLLNIVKEEVKSAKKAAA